jgi:hypothetical protein
MKFPVLDSDDDWTVNTIAKDQEAIKLDVKTAIKEWVGDCFFNAKAGIDWINRLDYNQKDQLDKDLRTLILSRNGVISITSLSIDVNNRKFTAMYEITTVYSKSIQDYVEVKK